MRPISLSRFTSSGHLPIHCFVSSPNCPSFRLVFFILLSYLLLPSVTIRNDTPPLPPRKQTLPAHRPLTPADYGAQYADKRPSIFLAIADTLEDLPTPRAEHHLLAEPRLEWEGNHIGASWPPLGNGEWLIPCHGKQDDIIGYTQSFMIARQNPATGWLEVTHRCSDRLMYAQKRWELESRFKTPCVFTCVGLVRGNQLVMSYGAADTFAGIAWADYENLIARIRRFDAQGRQNEPSGASRLQIQQDIPSQVANP